MKEKSIQDVLTSIKFWKRERDVAEQILANQQTELADICMHCDTEEHISINPVGSIFYDQQCKTCGTIVYTYEE